jgi:hypothetical protein
MDRVDYQSLIIQDLVNENKEKKLNLNPWYQRRSVWTRPQKAYLINTLFERKPIPAIYIRHTIDLDAGKSIKEVVDGQQRSRTIIEYCNGDFSAKLSDGKTRKTFVQLTATEREHFLLTPLPVGYLLGATDKDVIDIFGRINSVSKSLNPQERRNAAYSGEFKQFVLRKAIGYLEFWRSTGLFTGTDIARMAEVQFIADLIRNMIYGLSDFTQNQINKVYAEYDEEFQFTDDIEARMDFVFNIIMQMDPNVIKNTIFNRQPIFLSLALIIDEFRHEYIKDLEEKLFALDAEVKDENVKKEDTITFRTAISSTTQRIHSRRVRREFIISRIM